MRREDAASLLLLALALFLLLWRLESVPALTLDEAWLGLFAKRLDIFGLYTPHAMNRYTSALYGGLLLGSFETLGLSTRSLRLPGAMLNAAAFIGLWAWLRRNVSPQAALTWAALLAGSAYMLLKSRLAWEVYALHPILILGVLEGIRRPRPWLLAAVCLLGTANHFIFLTVPLSLVILCEDDEARPACAKALAASLAFAVVKHSITDQMWAANKLSCVAALTATPLAALIPVPRLRYRPLMALGLAAFGIWHLYPLLQALAGPVIFERMFAKVVALPMILWSAWIVVTVIRAQPKDRMERLLLGWPFAFAAIFIIFRNTSSLRYYSLPVMITLLAASAARTRGAVAAALLNAALLLPELASPGDRPPRYFRIGFHKENSEDFARKERLFAAFDASGACGITREERSFTAIPLFFHRLEKPACRPEAAPFEAPVKTP